MQFMPNSPRPPSGTICNFSSWTLDKTMLAQRYCELTHTLPDRLAIQMPESREAVPGLRRPRRRCDPWRPDARLRKPSASIPSAFLLQLRTALLICPSPHFRGRLLRRRATTRRRKPNPSFAAGTKLAALEGRWLGARRNHHHRTRPRHPLGDHDANDSESSACCMDLR